MGTVTSCSGLKMELVLVWSVIAVEYGGSFCGAKFVDKFSASTACHS